MGAPQELSRRLVEACRCHSPGGSSVWAHGVSFSLTIFPSNLPLHTSQGSWPVRQKLEDSVPFILAPQLLRTIKPRTAIS